MTHNYDRRQVPTARTQRHARNDLLMIGEVLVSRVWSMLDKSGVVVSEEEVAREMANKVRDGRGKVFQFMMEVFDKFMTERGVGRG